VLKDLNWTFRHLADGWGSGILNKRNKEGTCFIVIGNGCTFISPLAYRAQMTAYILLFLGLFSVWPVKVLVTVLTFTILGS
jgi:hypothetical protein